MSDATTDAPAPGGARPPRGDAEATWWQRIKPRHVGYVALLAVVVVCIYALAQLYSDDEGSAAGGAVERVIPANQSKILQQDQVGIDLEPGYEAELAVNGTPLPLDEVISVPELSQFSFQPGPGRVFEAWPAGSNCVVATFWRTETPNQTARTTWCFTVV